MSALKRQFTATEQFVDKSICYGALANVDALWLKGVTSEQIGLISATTDAGFLTFPVVRNAHNYFLQSVDGTDLAVLDTRTSTRLRTVGAAVDVLFEAVVDTSATSKRRKGGGCLKGSIKLSLNVYGPRDSDLADRVGDILSKASGYLQHPKALPPNMEYRNPHFLSFSEEDEVEMKSLIGISNKLRWSHKVKIADEITCILDQLSDVEMTAPWRGSLKGLSSFLKQHQQDALWFISQREDLLYSQALTANIRSETGPSALCDSSTNLGGLIADLMGLGKTLTMLAAILSTLPQAEEFGSFYEFEPEPNSFIRTKATLVVVSSAQLLENWKEEIQKHFLPEVMKFISFHGSHRVDNSHALVNADIVFTTYQTLAAESQALALLHKMHWFRVVLDEAHWIRNSASKQFRAVATLTTQRRWCITGTPIQNKLDDLTALAQFLRLPPFPDKQDFQKHILGPLSQGGPKFSNPLRAYLKAYCLRRTDKCLSLPQSYNRTIELEFSSEEKAMYQQLFDQARREIDEVVSRKAAALKKYNILFRAILKMRMLCNHGTRPKSAGPRLNLPGEEATACEYCMAKDEDVSMLLESYSFCPDCGRNLQVSTPCGPPSPTGSAISSLGGTTGDMETLDTSPSSSFSTKLVAIVDHVVTSGNGQKHLVFSSWTTTLDHLMQTFQSSSINALQIDGRTSYPERSRRLKAFREDPAVTVLLMSIETGSLGLTLTVAQNVHIVEPQWNPSVEEQAVARALRMGQTNEVTIFRYMMKNTVEQNIISLQQKKKNLARFTFDAAGGDDDVGGKLEDLRFTLDGMQGG